MVSGTPVNEKPSDSGVSLDPDNWADVRNLSHRMVDDMIDYLASMRERPVWSKMPDGVRSSFQEPLPHEPSDPVEVYEDFRSRILPYVVGNTHPRFMGWVHG